MIIVIDREAFPSLHFESMMIDTTKIDVASMWLRRGKWFCSGGDIVVNSPNYEFTEMIEFTDFKDAKDCFGDIVECLLNEKKKENE